MKWRLILVQLSWCVLLLSCMDEGENLVTAGGTGTPCVSDLDCKGDRICLSNGKCSDPDPIVDGETGSACGSDMDCKGDRICLSNGKCSYPDPIVNGETGSACGSDLDCKGDRICLSNGKCSDPDFDQPGGNGETGSLCSSDMDCKGDRTCLQSGKCSTDPATGDLCAQAWQMIADCMDEFCSGMGSNNKGCQCWEQGLEINPYCDCIPIPPGDPCQNISLDDPEWFDKFSCQNGWDGLEEMCPDMD